MIRVDVKYSSGHAKSVTIENKAKCAQWLSLVHQPWKTITITSHGNQYQISSKMDLNAWIEKNGK
jgi:hypothetical protein